jgi:hypothetical protein
LTGCGETGTLRAQLLWSFCWIATLAWLASSIDVWWPVGVGGAAGSWLIGRVVAVAERWDDQLRTDPTYQDREEAQR